MIALFTGPDLAHELATRRAKAVEEIRAADDDYLLTAPEDEWIAVLVDKYGIEIPSLRVDDATHEATGSPRRGAYGREITVLIRLPFDGHHDLFLWQPNLYGPIHPSVDRIEGGEIHKTVSFPHQQRPDLEAITRGLANEINTYLRVAVGEAEGHNQRLEHEVGAALQMEKAGLIEALESLEALSIPVRERPGAPKTYTAPGVRRRAAPDLPPRPAGRPSPLEPELLGDFYEHIVRVIRSTGTAMERTPGTFAEGSETQKRDVLLVMLNSHYEGAAAGEVFNGEGKADIVLRLADHNLLVAECKFWDGIETLKKALDQLEGYLTLRDTRAALIMFVTGRDVDRPVSLAREYFGDLPNSQDVPSDAGPTDFRVRLASTRHEDRAVLVHVLFFHVRAAAPAAQPSTR